MIINLNKEMISGGHSNMAPFPVIDYSVIFSNVDQQFGRVTPANAYFHTADWTLSYWWKLPAPAPNKFFYFQSGNLQSTMHASLGYVRWRFEDVDGNNNIITSTVNVCDGDWHHIAISCDRDGDIEMYVDGALDVTATCNLSATMDEATDRKLFFGLFDSTGTYYDGQIDQLAIFQLAFNSTQISSLYNSGNGVSNWTIMPISKSYWEFNEGSGTTASAFGSAATDMSLLSGTGNPVQWVGGLTD